MLPTAPHRPKEEKQIQLAFPKPLRFFSIFGIAFQPQFLPEYRKPKGYPSAELAGKYW